MFVYGVGDVVLSVQVIHFYSQKDLERDFGLVNAEYGWAPYVVLGLRERKKRSRS